MRPEHFELPYTLLWRKIENASRQWGIFFMLLVDEKEGKRRKKRRKKGKEI